MATQDLVSVPGPIVFRKGKRVYIRPVLREDLPQMTVWMNNQEMTQYLNAYLPMSPEDEVAWFEGIRARKPEDIVFAIVLVENNEMIGIMGLHHVEFRHGLASTGSFIGNNKYWGKGYGTEAKMLVLDYAFNTLNLRKICSAVWAFNKRSKRCLEKCGYREEGRRRQHKFVNGTYADELLMAVFKEDFIPLWKKFRKQWRV